MLVNSLVTFHQSTEAFSGHPFPGVHPRIFKSWRDLTAAKWVKGSKRCYWELRRLVFLFLGFGHELRLDVPHFFGLSLVPKPGEAFFDRL